MQRFDIEELEKSIGYVFKNKELLKEALTHSSYSNELRARHKISRCNERLEFLGDSVLSVIVSEYLFSTYTELPEGELSTMRSALVQSQALASYSRALGFGDFLYLGNGEEKNNGRERQSTLENVFEAIVAAIYLDAGEKGFKMAERFVLNETSYFGRGSRWELANEIKSRGFQKVYLRMRKTFRCLTKRKRKYLLKLRLRG